jgi:glycosyltransferase involved in cell wall biosynthesis
MKIALLSTCAVTTPPAGYGGTELVVAELARENVAHGHEVTVYATGDSTCAGERLSLFEHPVWPPSDLAEVRHAGFAWRDVARGDFDIVHANHAMQLPFAGFARFTEAPTVLTIHHHRDEALLAHYLAHPQIHYVAISARQAELAPELDYAAVIHHGIDPRAYPMGDGAGGYAAFLGRFEPAKAPHVAIDAALRAGLPIRLGGRPHDEAYHAAEMLPRLARYAGQVQNLGEVVHQPNLDLLRDARALLFPIDWEEPFGLVMIEAMMVGTPVIAFPRGAAPEVIDEGVTGFLVRDVDEMAARLHGIGRLDRCACRQRAFERFSTRRMAEGYLDLYARLAAGRRPPPRQTSHKADARPALTPSAAGSGAGGGR